MIKQIPPQYLLCRILPFPLKSKIEATFDEEEEKEKD